MRGRNRVRRGVCRIERGEGTLAEGKDHVLICDRNSKRSRGRGGRRNSEGNPKQRSTNPIGGSCGWEKESAARARSERAGNLAGYSTVLANEPEEEEEE